MNVLGVIPARYASSRFPGKPLCRINGKTMIQRVYEQSLKSCVLTELVVATDDERIFTHVRDFGGRVLMTSNQHQNGTSRIGEVLAHYQRDFPEKELNYVVNIQGDEPFINPEQIGKVVSCFKNERVQIATLVKRIDASADLMNPNVVKAVLAADNKVLYFSRNAVPFCRDAEKEDWVHAHAYYKHVGLYAYRADVLPVLVELQPTPLEKAESLEQLRWLENGFSIYAVETSLETIAIDTPDDLEKLDNSGLSY